MRSWASRFGEGGIVMLALVSLRHFAVGVVSRVAEVYIA
jgi:hypothetical protein